MITLDLLESTYKDSDIIKKMGSRSPKTPQKEEEMRQRREELIYKI